MPCPHNEITIVQRSQRQSAVAAAAYQSGEKLFCEYDQQVKHYPEKRGIVHNEILLPANAPPEYADRNTQGRILRTGESQRKDGRYAYKYTDACGKTQFAYAWKLVPTDKTPTGKRDDISLREKVKEILRDLNDGIDTIGKKMTVCQLYARQNSHRKNVKRSTEKGREYLMSVLNEDPLGSRSIDSVKLSDAKEWAIRMSEKGYAYKTISNWKRSLKAASTR